MLFHKESDSSIMIMSRLIIALSVLLLSCCAKLHQPKVLPIKPDTHQSQQWPDKPGVQILVDEQTVRLDNGCDNKVLPFLSIENHEVSPAEPKAGQSFWHRFIFVTCSAKPGLASKGKLTRKVFYQDQKKPIFKSVSNKVVVKPGKWADVSIIRIPPEAAPGIYTFQLTFSIPKAPKVTNELTFKIKE
jgi:hypothetical protein